MGFIKKVYKEELKVYTTDSSVFYILIKKTEGSSFRPLVRSDVSYDDGTIHPGMSRIIRKLGAGFNASKQIYCRKELDAVSIIACYEHIKLKEREVTL